MTYPAVARLHELEHDEPHYGYRPHRSPRRLFDAGDGVFLAQSGRRSAGGASEAQVADALLAESGSPAGVIGA